MKYINPDTTKITVSSEIVMATTLFTFLLIRIFTNGFNKIAIINAKAKGTRMLLSSKSINTKSIIPKSVTVDLKKKGYFFCIFF